MIERSENDIIEFAKIFNTLYANSYQSNLWAVAYIINGGCSDDGFDYFRGWLIVLYENTPYPELDLDWDEDDLEKSFLIFVRNIHR